jgi:DNA-binding GntR family transcriptional regulator
VKPVDIEETRELFEVREALESMSIQLAIERQKPGEVDTLEDIARKHAEYMPDRYDRQKIAMGVEFHIQIARMSKNQNLLRLLTVNLEHEYVRYTYDQADRSRMKPAVEEHFKILNSIRKKDTEKAVDLIRLHVKRNRDMVLELLKQQKESDELVLSSYTSNRKRKRSVDPT